MIIRAKISAESLGSFAKVVVDVEKKILSAGCELHSDCMQELIEAGSSPEYLWGANVYPETKKIDYISFINIRPAAGNRKMEITLPEIQEKVRLVIEALLF